MYSTDLLLATKVTLREHVSDYGFADQLRQRQPRRTRVKAWHEKALCALAPPPHILPARQEPS